MHGTDSIIHSCSLSLWVLDVYNNDTIMYMVYLVHVHYKPVCYRCT